MEEAFTSSTKKNGIPKEVFKDLPTNRLSGRDSPESGSLYSDYESGKQYEQDLPSGYNSGEQYDTLSTGYMSGEAYELPETRLELHEPTLDSIQEDQQGSLASNENLFTLAMPGANPPGGSFAAEAHQLMAQVDLMESSSSSSSSIPDNLEMAAPIDPVTAHKVKRKKTVSYCVSVPLETSPLGGQDGRGYRELPSDTDTTSCVYSDDANRASEVQSSDSGAALLKHSTRKKRRDRDHSEPGIIKGSRKPVRKSRKVNRNPEHFFPHYDTKYWAVTRNVCFWLSVLAICSSIVASIVLIVVMPRTCDPQVDWWQGQVVLGVVPAAADRWLDVDELMQQVPSLAVSGIRTVKLRDLYLDSNSSEEGNSSEAPVWFSCVAWDRLEGRINTSQVEHLAGLLHEHNMTLMVEIPAADDGTDKGDEKRPGGGQMPLALKQDVSRAIEFWALRGVDGVSLVGTERWAADPWLLVNSADWKSVLERYGTSPNAKILTTSVQLARLMDEMSTKSPRYKEIVPSGFEGIVNFNILDAVVSLPDGGHNNKTEGVAADVDTAAMWDTAPSKPWISWSLGLGDPDNNALLAFHMFLPGTISLGPDFLGQMTNINSSRADLIGRLIAVRRDAVPVYMNGVYPACHGHCANDHPKEPNHKVYWMPPLLLMERHFTRRHRYMTVANLGDGEAGLEQVAGLYSGGEVIVDTSATIPANSYVKFKEAKLPGRQAFVIKFPK